MRARARSAGAVIAACVGITLLVPAYAGAHCDGLDGPVVKAAQIALEKRDVTPVLKWVKKENEGEIRAAFGKTLIVRSKGPEARELADLYFFETLVRIHRAGEGAPYTGLKPAGRDLGPAIPAADKALREGAVKPLETLITSAAQGGLRERFKAVLARRSFREDDVEAGREYVEAYVVFIHYVERLYEAAQSPAHGHYPESEDVGVHKD